MKAVIFRQAQWNDETRTKFPANSMLICPDKLAKNLKDKYTQMGRPGVCEVNNINHYFPDFNKQKHARNPILFLRTGGIGDMMAFSTLFEQLKDHRTIFSTLNIYKPCFAWYTTPPGTIREITQPTFTDVTFSRLRSHFGNIRYANYEGQVENFQRKNWYQVFFEGIGLPWDEQLARPSLIKNRVTIDNRNSQIPKHKSLLIAHRASANMRTIDIEATLQAVERSKFHDWRVLFHELSLTQRDKEIIENSALNIKIIPPGTMHQALLDWYDAEFVISADTGAIHFREGVEKPALGIYAAFHPSSRTSTYRHVRSAYFTSLCPDQPCYLHESETIKTCPHGVGLNFAPCLSRRLSPDFADNFAHALNECFAWYSF